MSEQYVFELQFKGKADGSDYRENQFVIIDGSSMADFSKLKEDLGMCMPEPFAVQYIDDEDDIISIDTEEEFQEFAKIAKKRSSRGMLMRLILNSNLPLDHGQFTTPPSHTQETPQSRGGLHLNSWTANDMSLSNRSPHNQRKMKEFKEKIKSELKNEIMLELKEKMGQSAQASGATTTSDNPEAAAGSSKDASRMEEEVKEAEYEEDSDGNMFLVYVPEKKKGKLLHYQKKLEKKEKLVEAKIDQRLEKLEMKRKKLMEKYNSHHKQLTRKPAVDPKIVLPMIFSAIATKESSEMPKRVTATKIFTHIWTILNDGTVPLNSVELRHTWSSHGLEPEETSVKLAHLLPCQEASVAVRFKAPKTFNCSFISYWHFFRLVDNRWQEFGHYVSLTGSTKPPKSTPYDFPPKLTETNKKQKQDQRSVSFIDAVDDSRTVAEAAPKDAQKEEKVLNEESLSNISLKQQLEQLRATLASGQIAAEMAKEAARLQALAAAAAEGNTASPGHTAPKPSEGDKLNVCGLEEATAGVQQLNLVDSESDTDANIDTNEDSDRGFVIVTMTAEQPNEEASEHVAGTANEEGKEDNKTATSSVDNGQKEEAQAQAHPEPMSFPRLDPNVNYPVFPPPPPTVANGSMYLPHSPMMPNNVFSPLNYPVFPPAQNASSHGIVFPPPLLSIAPTKLTPAVNYSQIPAYPPIPPIPAFPPTVTLPITTPPAFVSQPSQNLPHHTAFTHFTPITLTRTVPNTEAPNGHTDERFWAPVYNHHPEASAANSSTNSSVSTTEKPAENKTQELSNTAPTDNSMASAPAAETSQPQQQQQPQHQQAEANNEQNKNTEPVQILPQVLVDGAINAAATAYSTAWNALNNLRPKEGLVTEFDPVFENNMAMLVEMGFNNLERNARLLKRFNNDISQVIGIICSTGGSHNLDID